MAREAVEAMFAGSLRMTCDKKNPGGCMVVQAGLSCGEGSEAIRLELTAVREAGVNRIRERFEQAQAAGELPKTVNCGDLARYVGTVIHGLGVQAAGGATRQQLERVVEIAMRAWPA